jgi:hypothetical protein
MHPEQRGRGSARLAPISNGTGLEVNLKNIAGNDASIFLFRFELLSNRSIDFVLNEEIAADMYPDVNE